MSRSFQLAAAGRPARDLPAYRLQPPVSGWLVGYQRDRADWVWQEPPPDEVVTDPHMYEMELKICDA